MSRSFLHRFTVNGPKVYQPEKLLLDNRGAESAVSGSCADEVDGLSAWSTITKRGLHNHSATYAPDLDFRCMAPHMKLNRTPST